MAFDPSGFDQGGYWTAGGFTPGDIEVTTVIKVDGVDITDVVDLKRSTWQMNASVNPGPAQIYVRDLGHDYDFTTGLETTLDINGLRVWGGFVMGVRRHYAFDVDDTSNPNLTPRYLILECADYNILFSKRFVYNKDDPTVSIPTYDAGVFDSTVVRELVADFLDLSGDGIQTAGIRHVGTPVEDMAANLFQPPESFGDAMRLIAQMPGAIFYFDPYKNLNYADVDIPSAPFKLSDVPNNSTSFGYGWLELTNDGTVLANDAMVWGAAIGRNTLTFQRYENDDSIDEHGLWQWADFRQDLYKPESVLKRATTYVEGSVQNNRGHKDDAISIRCTTRYPGMRAGMRVDFENQVHGYHDVIPIRTMRIRFVNPNEALYDLTLAHYIDEAWNTAEFPRPHSDEPVPVCEHPTPTDTDTTVMFDDFERSEPSSWGATSVGGYDYTESVFGGSIGVGTFGGEGAAEASFGNGGFKFVTSTVGTGTGDGTPWQDPDGWDVTFRFWNQAIYNTLGRDAKFSADITGDNGNGVGFELDMSNQAGIGSVYFQAYGDTFVDDTVPKTDWVGGAAPSQTIYKVRLQYVADSTVKLKIWKEADTEPSTWLSELALPTGIDMTGAPQLQVTFSVGATINSNAFGTNLFLAEIAFVASGSPSLTVSRPVLGSLTAYDTDGNELSVLLEDGVVIPGADICYVADETFDGPTTPVTSGTATGSPNVFNGTGAAYGENWVTTAVQLGARATPGDVTMEIVGGQGHFISVPTGYNLQSYTGVAEIQRVGEIVSFDVDITQIATLPIPEDSGGTLSDNFFSVGIGGLVFFEIGEQWVGIGTPTTSYEHRIRYRLARGGGGAEDTWDLVTILGSYHVDIEIVQGSYAKATIGGVVLEIALDPDDAFTTGETHIFFDTGVNSSGPAPFEEWDPMETFEVFVDNFHWASCGITGGSAYLDDVDLICYETTDSGDVFALPAGDVYRPAHVRQLGWGSAFDGLNCTMASACIALDRHTEGAKTSNPPLMRSFQSDQVGGTDLNDAADAWAAGYGETLTVNTVSWATFVSQINAGRGAIVQGDYQEIPDAYSGQPSFDGPHAIYVNEFNSDVSKALVYDPLRSSAYWLPSTYLRNYAEAFAGGSVAAGFTQIT